MLPGQIPTNIVHQEQNNTKNKNKKQQNCSIVQKQTNKQMNTCDNYLINA